MAKKRNKFQRYIPPPVPEVAPEVAEALEKSLRAQVDSAFLLQEPKDEIKTRFPWLHTLLFDPKRQKR